MYASLATNPIVGLTIQYSTAATGFAILREDQPVFTFTIFDPELRATTGVEGLYSTGVVLVPDLLIRGNLFGRPGIMELGGSWSSAEYTSLSPNSYLNPAIPELAASYANQFGQLPVKTGSWCMWSNFYQALWVDRVDENVNWGVFGEFGISDGNPNPVQFVANGGITGQSMIPGRKLDAFGIGYFYLGLSDSFKSLASPISPQVDERGVELFYNYAIKPSMRLTFDLQLVRPSTSALETAIIPGIRFQTIF